MAVPTPPPPGGGWHVPVLSNTCWGQGVESRENGGGRVTGGRRRKIGRWDF